MKKSLVVLFVLVIAVMSVMAVSAAPRDRYYDQMRNKYWGNSDSYGLPEPCSAEDWALVAKEEAFRECANRCYDFHAEYFRGQEDLVVTYCSSHATPTNIKCDPDTGLWAWTCKYY